jgi:hypothetical protein
VFLAVVWHERVASESREIDTETMQKFNHRGLAPDLRDRLEAARESLNPRLRGEKLDAWIEEWNKANLTPEQMISLGSWTASRFKAGKTAIPLKWLEKIAAKEGKPFANAEALHAWLNEEGFPEELKQKVIDTVPNTIMQAKDVVLCLDSTTGSEKWRWSQPGKPTGRHSSSTPAVVDGKVYALMGTEIVCVSESDGAMVWKASHGGKGPGSSPLVIDGKVFCNGAPRWPSTRRLGSSCGRRRSRARTPRAPRGGRLRPASRPLWCKPTTSSSASIPMTVL